MEQFFDLREFLIMLLKKSRIFIILAVIFGIVGAAVGFLGGGDTLYTSTASASVNTTGEATDATALTSVMTSIKDTVGGDFFYTGILSEIRGEMDDKEFATIFGDNAHPSITSLKKVIRLYVNGNLVLADVTSKNQDLSTEAANIARRFVAERLSANINNITITNQGVLTVDKAMQAGDTVKSRVMKYGVFGAAGGVVVGVLWIFFVDAMSLVVRKPEDIKKFRIPRYELSRNGAITILASLRSKQNKKNEKSNLVIGVTSSHAGESIDQVAASIKEHALAFVQDSTIVAIDESAELISLRAHCDELREKAGITLLMLPPLPKSEAGIIAASCCDCVLLTERCGVSRVDEMEQALLALQGLGIPMDTGKSYVGFILLPARKKK